MSTDTKALIAATPATVALVRRELDKSREAQRGGMTCGTPKAVNVDCAMVERLCRIAEKQADRLAALEEQLHLTNVDALQTEAERAALEAENQRLREALTHIKRVMGPKVPPCCGGCAAEWQETLDTANTALAAGGEQ